MVIVLQLLLITSVVGPSLASWKAWLSWTPCSDECGPGTKSRSKECVRYTLDNGECSCSGSDIATQKDDCSGTLCKDDEGFYPWSEWSECTSYCTQGGERFRHRTCTRNRCQGDTISTEPCMDVTKCNGIHGSWSSWGEWSDCSATCGHGYHYRKRYCNDPEPKYNGTLCEGPSFHVLPCIAEPKRCPVTPKYGPWSGWSEWKQAGGNMEDRVRMRVCDNPAPSEPGVKCKGNWIQRQERPRVQPETENNN